MKRLNYLILFILFANHGYSQIGNWTWMSGDKFIHSKGNFGTKGIPNKNNAPQSLYEPCEWKDLQGNFWIFGGFHVSESIDSISGEQNNLWKYNPVLNEWTWIKGPGIGNDLGYFGVQEVPSLLNNPAARAWGTPTWTDKKGDLWLYGGSIGYNDLWRYNISSNEWTWMKGDTGLTAFGFVKPVYGIYQQASILNSPGSRAETATSWTDNEGNLWLFGGGSYDPVDGEVIYNDLWKYDILINQWAWMSGSNKPNDKGHYGTKGIPSSKNCPPARYAYAKWKDPLGNFYFFGGLFTSLDSLCYYHSYNDVWKYDLILNNWIWIGGDSIANSSGSYSKVCESKETNIPRNGYENRATCFDSLGNVYMFGSIGSDCENDTPIKNELWHYSTVNNEWTLLEKDWPISWGKIGVASNSNSPPKTFGTVAWWRKNEVWIFGGSQYGNSASYNCLWKYSIDTSCFTTNVKEINVINDIKLYPNPSNSYIKVSINLDSKQTIELKIYNALGQEVFGSIDQNVYDKYEKEINIQNLSKSIYFLRIKQDNLVSFKSFVVN